MSSRLSFACMLHDIWMKVATSYALKEWKSQILHYKLPSPSRTPTLPSANTKGLSPLC